MKSEIRTKPEGDARLTQCRQNDVSLRRKNAPRGSFDRRFVALPLSLRQLARRGDFGEVHNPHAGRGRHRKGGE